MFDSRYIKYISSIALKGLSCTIYAMNGSTFLSLVDFQKVEDDKGHGNLLLWMIIPTE